MAGTIFGLGLSQQTDDRGRPLSGALLYIYDANTSTPVNIYNDFSLADATSNPIEADGAGRLPAFWLDDGDYRVRLTTSTGVEVFDEQSVTALGASASSGGGESVSQDSTTLFQTGYYMWLPVAGTLSGWVRSNGKTIGSSSSAGTERANSDTQALYEYLWANFTDAQCPVSTGRGASASADFNANKTIGTLDMRGMTNIGLDDMGSSAASRITVGSPTSAASSGGAEKQTIATGNLPSHTHDVGTLAGSFSYGWAVNDHASGAISGIDNTTGSDYTQNDTVTITGATAATGSGTALTTTPPYRLGSWYVKL
jgi:microcystin-dependent protein